MMNFENIFVKNEAVDTPVASSSKESAVNEEAGAAEHCDDIDIKEEPVFIDLCWSPVHKIEEPYIEEENFKLEIPEGQTAQDPLCVKKEEMVIPDEHGSQDPLQVKNEELSYEAVAAASGSERESCPVDGDSSSDHSGTHSTRDTLEVGTGHSIQCTAEQEEWHVNERGMRQQKLDCEDVSTQLRGPEENRQVGVRDSLISCNMCNKTFKQRWHLKEHLEVHTGERPYSCTICSKTFTRKAHLMRHSSVHTGEQPYWYCTICGKKFTRMCSLRRHSVVHVRERPHSCTICGSTYIRSDQLKRHSLRAHGDGACRGRPYSCTICGTTFTRSDNLRRHGNCDVIGTARPWMLRAVAPTNSVAIVRQ